MLIKGKEIINSHYTVSVVICCNTINRLDWIIETVSSLQKQSRPPEEVIVIFDRVEGLGESLHRRLPTFVKIIANSSNSGLSLARNTGISSSSSDIVAFLDDDATAESDWLKYLIAPFDDPQVIGTGGKAVPHWLGSGNRPFWFPEEIDWVVGCMHIGFGDGQKIVRNVFGCNMCFRKQQINEVGGFDFRLGGSIAGDDTDFCLRISRGDKLRQIIYEPKAIIHHKVPIKRQSFRYVAYSTWKQGIGKAVTERIHQNDERALSSEKSYIKLLLLKFFPSQLRRFFKHPISTIGQTITVVIVIASFGVGYTMTRMRLVKIRC